MASLRRPDPQLLAQFRQRVLASLAQSSDVDRAEASPRQVQMLDVLAKIVDEARQAGVAQKSDRIWLFGSFAWGQPDEHSDVDLLIDGVAHQSILRSSGACDRAHRGLAEPTATCVAPGPPPMSSPTFALQSLQDELREDWSVLVRLSGKAQSVDPVAGEAEAALVCLSICRAYTAFEALLQRIESHLGRGTRQGHDWHQQLLTAAARPVPGLRDALYPSEAERDWHELRRFRHFVQHSYGVVDIDSQKVTAVRLHLADAIEKTQDWILEYVEALSPSTS